MRLKLNHVAMVCRSGERADRFYGELLGLAKAGPFVLPPELTKAIFNIEREMTVFNYSDDQNRFEIFVDDNGRPEDSIPLPHVCIEVNDVEELAESAKSMGYEVILAPKGDRILTFILDHDRNLFEVKTLPNT